MFVASNSVPTPEIVWWALLPLIVFAVSGLLLLTISSLLKKEIIWLAPTFSLTAGIFVLISAIPMWNRIQNDIRAEQGQEVSPVSSSAKRENFYHVTHFQFVRSTRKPTTHILLTCNKIIRIRILNKLSSTGTTTTTT